MKATIKSLWAQHKNSDKVLEHLKLLPSTPELRHRWAEYAIANDLTVVFEWVCPQLDPKHNPLRLEQACVYNRGAIVSFLLRTDPQVKLDAALKTAAQRGRGALVEMLCPHADSQTDGCALRYIVCEAACTGRQLQLLQSYLASPNDLSRKQMTQLMQVAAGKNFSQGLTHLLEFGLDGDEWARVADECLQLYALQSECMMVLLNNIPANTPAHVIERKVGDALQRLAAVSKLDDPQKSEIATALMAHTTFERFMANHRTPMVRSQKDTLEYLWHKVQRNAILQHIETPQESTAHKRRM